MVQMSDRISKANVYMLVLVCLAQFLEVMNSSTMTVALPAIQSALHMQANDLQWIVTSYVLTFACFLLIGGRASDILGRKRVLIMGLSMFAVASLAGGLAMNPGWLIAFRAIQGIGAALSIPAAMSLISTSIPEGAQRNKAFAIFGALGSSGFAAGSIVGGLLTDSVGWRSLFFLNVPLVLAIIIGLTFVKEGPIAKRTKESIDLFGALSVLLGIFVLVFGLSQPDVDGSWGSLKIGSLIVGVIILIIFVLIEKKSRNPIMPLRLFKIGSLVSSNIIGFLMYSFMTGFIYFSTLYFHELGYSSLRTGLAFLPLGLSSVLATQITPLFLRKFSVKTILIVSQIVNAIGLFWLSTMSHESAYFSLIFPIFIVLGISIAAGFTAIIVGSVQDVKPEEHGIAGGIVNTFLQLGGSLGLSILATIASSVTASETTKPASAAMIDGFQFALKVGGYFAVFAIILVLFSMRKKQTSVRGQQA